MEQVNPLKDFIIENFLYGDKSSNLGPGDSLMERGIVDSTGVLELVAFIEGTYGIKIADEEIVPENFDSISKISGFIERKRSGTPHAG